MPADGPTSLCAAHFDFRFGPGHECEALSDDADREGRAGNWCQTPLRLRFSQHRVSSQPASYLQIDWMPEALKSRPDSVEKTPASRWLAAFGLRGSGMCARHSP